MSWPVAERRMMLEREDASSEERKTGKEDEEAEEGGAIKMEAWENEDRDVEEERGEEKEEGVEEALMQLMQGRSGVVMQLRFWLAQKVSPPSAHSLPWQRVPVTGMEEDWAEAEEGREEGVSMTQSEEQPSPETELPSSQNSRMRSKFTNSPL